MIGIYKITSPTGKVYIGQSINIENRFKSYKWYKAKKQTLLNRSFLKYGVENHLFEILTECDKTQLHKLETYYQELFCVTNKNGLNCFINKESSIKKIILRKEQYKKEKAINDFYLKNKELFVRCSKIIDDIL